MGERMKWVDPRPPVSVSYVGRYKITIFGLAAYEQSKIDYPDDPDQPARPVRNDNDKPAFARRKPAARWNWVTPLGNPIGRVEQLERKRQGKVS